MRSNKDKEVSIIVDLDLYCTIVRSPDGVGYRNSNTKTNTPNSNIRRYKLIWKERKEP